MFSKSPRHVCWLACICFILLTSLALQSEDDDNTKKYDFSLDRFELHLLPCGWLFPTIIENYAPDATSLIEENNGFALIDAPRVYFEGDSIHNFNWYINDVSIQSALTSGAPAIILPFSLTQRMSLLGASPKNALPGFHFIPIAAADQVNAIFASTIYANMGGWLAIATVLNSNHPSNRNEELDRTRRRFDHNIVFDYTFNQPFAHSSLALALSYFTVARSFNDFTNQDFTAHNKTFSESGEFYTVYSRYCVDVGSGRLELSAAANRLWRNKLYAELGRLPDETYTKSSTSGFLNANYTNGSRIINAYAIIEDENLTPNCPNFSKDLFDNDGEGFFPFERQGHFRTITTGVDANDTWQFGSHMKIIPHLSVKTISLTAQETSFAYNAITMQQAPFLVYVWDQPGSPYSNRQWRLETGFTFQADITRAIDLTAKLWWQCQNFDFSKDLNSFSLPFVAYDVGITFFKHANYPLMLAYGCMPIEAGSEELFFAEGNRPGASIYSWNDRNHNGKFELGEQGQLYSLTGGMTHTVDAHIRTPYCNRLLLNFDMPVFGSYHLAIKGLYKWIYDPFWVNYGAYNSQNLYILSSPPQQFVLGNATFPDQPFYGEFLLRLYGGKPDYWFFSFSILAHIGMGYTAFGNGVENDIGTISESMANPNSWINGYGRVDGDRAYVIKLFYGFYPIKNLFVSLDLKYRDGDPFAFIRAQNSPDWILTYVTIRAENARFQKGGPREDYISDLSIRAGYSFTICGKRAEIALACLNLLDLGNELSEDVYTPFARRNAMELQIPRSLRAEFRLAF